MAETQHGIVALHHLRDLGIGEHEREHLRASGDIVRTAYGAYRVVGAPPTWRGDLVAAVWAGGTRAVASHRSGAAVWDVAGGVQSIQEVMCPRWRRTRHGSLVVHESKVLDDVDMTLVDAIPVTTIERTILDLGAVCSPLIVERAMEDALRRELTTLDALGDTVSRLGRRGRNGAGVLRAILGARDPERALTDTTPELMMLQVFRRNGLPDPVPQFVVRDNGRFVARVDAALPQWKIAFEYESYQWHTSKAALDRDTARRRKLMAIQWWPIGVTGADLRSGGAVLCDQIFRIIRNAAA